MRIKAGSTGATEAVLLLVSSCKREKLHSFSITYLAVFSNSISGGVI